MTSRADEPVGALDDAAQGFSSFEKELGRRGAKTTRSREDANALKAAIGAWFEVYYPALIRTLGELAAIDEVNKELRDLRALAGGRMDIESLRKRLRAVTRKIEQGILPSYDAARWSAAVTDDRPSSEVRESLAARLGDLSPDLATSYQQVHEDLVDPNRISFLGPAGEVREVLRGAMHLLAPDDDVKAEAWFVGHEGRPMQAERIRYIIQSKSGADSAIETAEVIDEKVSRLGRLLYQRASKSFHAGTQRDEVGKIVVWVEAVLNEILPP
jgi:hypothetical protein